MPDPPLTHDTPRALCMRLCYKVAMTQINYFYSFMHLKKKFDDQILQKSRF